VADRLVPDSVGWLATSEGTHRARFALRLEPEERIVGFGERFDALDQRGRTLDSRVFEQYKQQGNRTYMPMPFAIVVGGGWGFHVATSRRVWFDVGETDPDRLWIEVELAGEPEPEIELELFDGSPRDVLATFLARTGRPVEPPDWIFTPWMSGNEWNTQARVIAEVERSEHEGIPVGVVVIEAWSDESTFTAFRDAEYIPHEDGSPHTLADFTFPADGAWPDPKGMIDALHARGVRVLLWQIPLLRADAVPDGQLGHDRRVLVERGYAVREADGRPYANRGWWFPDALLPDFTSPEARAWWLAKRRYLVEELGIDGFKTDGGEHAWGDDLLYADGTRGIDTNNRYPVLYAAAYHELLGSERITFSRAGFTGSASYPCHWAGDEDSTWEAFRASITAGLTAGACGVFFWGWDLAGFSGEIPDAELYLRSAAMACFCPIMQYHSEYNHHRAPSRDRTPWNIAERTGDARVLPVYRRFARLRMGLVAYLREQSRACVRDSKPLMRAPFFEVEDDPRIWEFPYQYFLGDSVLVAPVTEPGIETLRVYLPPGDWIDPWTKSEHAGPMTVEREVPIDEIAVYVAADRAPSLVDVFKPALLEVT
jgi:alpha-glucosidase (family GH31 glycosyl hydrolase)